MSRGTRSRDVLFGHGTTPTQRLREQMLGESKYGSSMKFTERFKTGLKVILAFWQTTWDRVLTPLGIHGHSVVRGTSKEEWKHHLPKENGAIVGAIEWTIRRMGSLGSGAIIGAEGGTCLI